MAGKRGRAGSRPKVTVIGAGMVGGTVAQMLALRDYADIVLVDIVEGLPQGKALDLLQVGPIVGYDSNLTGVERLRRDGRFRCHRHHLWHRPQAGHEPR